MNIVWKKYNYVIIFIGLTILMGLCFLFNMEDHSNHYQNIVVQKGQTLWNIADEYADKNSMSKDEFIHWVENHNEINADLLKAGEEIKIPVTEHQHSVNQNQEYALNDK
ncbi:cell division suppressor protein YneA [Heyndrickxia ginsengihumi]|uniref:LysM peptidoglycan-binding domain-containing protein n=1 Tax=Heyndrickxia ginsengihumi TaxID=363870 RepID=A0A0A6VFJ1_9BACI|nr:LysM peptidoglycan-binding domain-containing protein [Heyndrickxia ginsengihumi]KHD85369.1 hypothetical protein NG54_09720 [Heyndrickxia ginsengihumi]MBE6183131.1 LysM peptidoglycan-binding domain-containing protein [Bacillus sp. (in: firmicutes)]MCM3024234.1 LysM peptidoglycan-binding domain-containing protein [Heyndrickxia ginsengihumi]NEY20590.1 LysM peptidoglycan-binding domain-containing protein [Heyndrickxia ginsengihumi]